MGSLSKCNLSPDRNFQEWKFFRCQMTQYIQTSFNNHKQKEKRGEEKKWKKRQLRQNFYPVLVKVCFWMEGETSDLIYLKCKVSWDSDPLYFPNLSACCHRILKRAPAFQCSSRSSVLPCLDTVRANDFQ